MLIIQMKHLKKHLIFFSSLISLLAINAVSISANNEITVHSGDTVTGLSQKYHVSASAIKKVNHLRTDTLSSGRKITLPNQTDQNIVSSDESSNTRQDTEDTTSASLLSKEQSAKNWIAYHESRGQYSVSNGQYYGKFELDTSLLNGDYSKRNQERVADKYVHQRYGSWIQAKHFWETHNWY